MTTETCAINQVNGVEIAPYLLAETLTEIASNNAYNSFIETLPFLPPIAPTNPRAASPSSKCPRQLRQPLPPPNPPPWLPNNDPLITVGYLKHTDTEGDHKNFLLWSI